VIYSAHVVAGDAPHSETPGISIHMLVDTGHGWADRGSVQEAEVTMVVFDADAANAQLAVMGWRRTGAWVNGGGIWFAPVTRSC